MLNSKLTPGQAAKQWAKEHPDFMGELAVESLTRKGRGGWGTTNKTTRFVVSGGLAAAIRDDRQAGTFNGVCDLCEKVYLDRVLAWAFSRDPRAGQRIADEELDAADPRGWRRQQETLVYADWMSWGIACPDCRAANGLKTDTEIGGYERYQEGGVYLVSMKRPGYRIATTNKETLDIRELQ